VRIGDEPRVVAALQMELGKRNAPPTCTAWLDGQRGDPDCEALLKSSATQAEAQLKDMMSKMKRGGPRSPPPPGFDLMFPDLIDAERALKVVVALREELTRLSSVRAPRSGGAEFVVGIMNTGASDGTVFNRGRLTFHGGEFNVFADGYVAAKAHSFVEVTFRTARETQGETEGSWTTGEEGIVKAWSDLVKKGNEIPFTLVVTMSSKSVSTKGRLYKE